MRDPQTNGFILVGGPLDIPPCSPACYAPGNMNACQHFMVYSLRLAARDLLFVTPVMEQRRKGRTFLFNDALDTFCLVMLENHCCYMNYTFQLASRVLLYAPFHRQDTIYHSLCYTNCGALVGASSSSLGLPCRIDLVIRITISRRSTMDMQLQTSVTFNYWRKEGNVLFNNALNTFYLWH